MMTSSNLCWAVVTWPVNTLTASLNVVAEILFIACVGVPLLLLSTITIPLALMISLFAGLYILRQSVVATIYNLYDDFWPSHKDEPAAGLRARPYPPTELRSEQASSGARLTRPLELEDCLVERAEPRGLRRRRRSRASGGWSSETSRASFPELVRRPPFTFPS
ncbi:hypothetical protein BDY17DRAFT_41012 [Neohortaea acidophila]|uniref:Uncharacterized protein n=1 Tax=Neohortaea acidophila TaxID=245834 RepID=A0A6A6PIB7_9PEZI|nr:uncharacterized protein BDY17DRAFT_41012 [Neohortaea acidophila]KAF2479536.1 hypothetical protein BDY17DRAFT_41012 [Neohortaea acidophila]